MLPFMLRDRDFVVFLQGNRPLCFDLGVFGELGARRFRGMKRVRAKAAKDAKVRKRDC